MWNVSSVLNRAKDLTSNIASTLLEGDDDEQHDRFEQEGHNEDQHGIHTGHNGLPDQSMNGSQITAEGVRQKSLSRSAASGTSPNAAKTSSIDSFTSSRSQVSMFGTLSSATNMLQRVATHVVGGEEVASPTAGPRQKTQLDAVKAQLVETAKENDALLQENSMLQQKLQRMQKQLDSKQADVDVQSAQEDKLGLLTKEIAREQAARKEVEQQLRQAKDLLDQSQAAVADRDTFWIQEVERQRAQHTAELDSLKAQLEKSSRVSSGNADNDINNLGEFWQQLQDAQAKASSAETELVELRSKLTAAVAARTAAEDQATSAGRRLAETDSQMAALQQKLHTLEQELSGERELLSAAESELETLRNSEVGSLREQLEMMKELYEEERGYTLEARAALKAAQEQLSKLQATGGQQQQQESEDVEQCKQQIADLQASLEATRTELAEARDNILKSQQGDASLRDELSSAQAELRKFTQQLTEQQDALAGKETALQTCQKEVQELRQQVLSLQQQMDVSKGAGENSQQRLLQLEEKLSSSLQQQQAMEQELQLARSQLAEAENKIQELQQAEAAARSLQEESLSVTRQLADVKQEAAAYQQQLQEVQQQLIVQQSQYKAVTQQLSDATQLSQTKDDEIQKLKAAVSSEQAKATSHESNTDKLRRQVALLEGQLSMYQEQQGCQLDEALKDRDAFWQAELKSKDAALDTANKLLAQVQQQAEVMQADVLRAEQQMPALRVQIQEMHTLLAEKEQELKSATQQLTSLQSQLQHSQGQAVSNQSDMQRQLADAKQLITRLQEQLTAAHASPSMAPAAPTSNQDTQQIQELQNTISQLQSEGQQLRDKLSAAQQSISANDAEKERLKAQLARLKEQMLKEQDDEDDKLSWRVEEEVRSVRATLEASHERERETWAAAAAKERERFLAEAEQERARHATDKSELAAALQAAKTTLSRLQNDAEVWEEVLAAKDRELANLQAALGELTYESEAAERLRLEVRAATSKAAAVSQQLEEAGRQVEAARAAQRNAEATAARATAAMDELRNAAQRSVEECGMLRHALDAAMAQVQSMNSASSSSVDKRIVAKLLITYFDRGCSRDVLALMARMLNMSDEETQRVNAAASRKGILSRVAGAPIALVAGAGRALVGGPAAPRNNARASGNGDSLADQWVDFLLSQAERENAQRSQAAASNAPQPDSSRSTSGAGFSAGYPTQAAASYPDLATLHSPSAPASGYGRPAGMQASAVQSPASAAQGSQVQPGFARDSVGYGMTSSSFRSVNTPLDSNQGTPHAHSTLPPSQFNQASGYSYQPMPPSYTPGNPTGSSPVQSNGGGYSYTSPSRTTPTMPGGNGLQ